MFRSVFLLSLTHSAGMLVFSIDKGPQFRHQNALIRISTPTLRGVGWYAPAVSQLPTKGSRFWESI